jgi:hypothetical protein
MITKLKLNSKNITRKALYEKYGEKRVKRFIGDAKETYINHPSSNPIKVVISLDETVLITFVESGK